MLSLYDRAAVIPGRSLTRSKAPDRLLDDWAVAANGAWIYGASGRIYLDTLCGLGAISLGYQTIRMGSAGVCSLPWTTEVLAAEAVLKHVAPWASSVRFFKTGSECTHAAYRIAKRATGKHITLRGDWAYHGWHEWTEEHPNRFPNGCDLSAIYGDLSDRVAAVFIEPHRWESVDMEWLRSVRAFCDRVGALLVFDSMIYGGRMAFAGTSEYFGVRPDLECYGKAFGNGASVAFIVGNTALAEHGEIASGTYSGDFSGLQACIDVIQFYQDNPVIETLWARGRQLQEGLRQVMPSELAACEGLPVHQRVRFFDADTSKRFARAMAERGILWHEGCQNIMYAHSEQHMEQVIEAAQLCVAAL